MTPLTNELSILYTVINDLRTTKCMLQSKSARDALTELIEKYETKVTAAQQTAWEDARNAFHTLD